MILNTLAWLVILRTKSLHNMTNFLLAYLAIVDSILCCQLLVLINATTGREIYCRIVSGNFIEWLTAYLSIYALCLVTYERYIGIVHPLHYPRMMSAKKTILIIFIALGMSFAISTPRLFTTNASNGTCTSESDTSNTSESVSSVLFFLFGYLLPILFMSWIYYKIQATLKRSAQQLQRQNVEGAALELFQARQNVISMLKIVMGALLFLWTPLILYSLICLTEWGYFKICLGRDVLGVVVVMHRLNSVINPIIYIFKYKKFRKGLQDMLCCCIGRPPRPDRIGVKIAMNERNVLDEH
ncbi:galanin receptor type 2-like [Asterias amurensis]|uniref:galanin receptor type 2-like n=1 Tax=Asterias amurensis TaxID=7602 RepID=UPI003AB4DDB8